MYALCVCVCVPWAQTSHSLHIEVLQDYTNTTLWGGGGGGGATLHFKSLPEEGEGHY